MTEERQQGGARNLLAVDTAQMLAGHRSRTSGHVASLRNSPPQCAFEAHHIQLLEHVMQRRDERRPAFGKSQGVRHRLTLVTPRLPNGVQAASPHSIAHTDKTRIDENECCKIAPTPPERRGSARPAYVRARSRYGGVARGWLRPGWTLLQVLSCSQSRSLVDVADERASVGASDPLVLECRRSVGYLGDTTLERQQCKKLAYKNCFYDAVRSRSGHKAFSMGIRWLSLCLLVKVPWSTRLWAVPSVRGVLEYLGLL
jgi:hypothetical protein